MQAERPGAEPGVQIVPQLRPQLGQAFEPAGFDAGVGGGGRSRGGGDYGFSFKPACFKMLSRVPGT